VNVATHELAFYALIYWPIDADQPLPSPETMAKVDTFLKNGGMFVPTTKAYKIGDEVYLILSFMDDPAKYPIAGKVAWITPAGANNSKAQGIGVHFPLDESGQRARMRIEEILGAALRSSRATHTL